MAANILEQYKNIFQKAHTVCCSDSKLTDSSVLLRKLLPLYGVRKSIATIWKQAAIMDFLRVKC